MIWVVFFLAASVVGASEPTALMRIMLENPELKAESSSDKFIVPNEFDNHLQYEQLAAARPGEKTAVLSVGSVRSFNLLGVARRDSLVAIDYADGMPPFNDNFARLIESRERTKFLAGILGLPAGVEGKFDLTSREGFLAAVSHQLDSRTRPESRDPLLQKLYSALPPPKPGAYSSPWYSWLLALKNYAATESNWRGTFFGSEEAFGHVQKVIRAGNFHSVHGSLSGDKAMKQIGEYLRGQGFTVSELDVSNAVEHIARYEGETGLKRFGENVKQLPLTQQSRVLITVDGMQVQPGQLALEPRAGQWHYLVRNVPDALSALENGSSPKAWASGLDRTNKSCSVFFDRL